MKKALVLVLLLSGLLFPLACSDNNAPSNPVVPPGGGSGVPTKTPVGTQTPGTPTFTPSPVPGANTPTFTPTFSVPIPVFLHNTGTTAAPNGIVINGAVLSAGEFETNSKGPVPMVQSFSIGGGGTLNVPAGQTNYVLQGIPTPCSTPIWVPNVVGLNGPQGFVNPGGGAGYASILDNQAGGGAVLYYGSAGMLAWTGNPALCVQAYGFLYQPDSTNGYGGAPFNNPKGMTADNNGNIYIADTGNATVEQFAAGINAQHRWYGAAGITFGGFVSVFFKTPYAVACDTSSPATVWVGDVGYTPSVIEAFSSGGTTISAAWPTIPGCQVHGIAVNPVTGNIYVADAGNNLVEIYSPTGTLLGEFGDPGPAANEFLPFAPSCIAFSGTYLFVGDTNNDFIDIFQ